MNILEVYKQYQIMPQLMEHQLRVAAVADLICDSFAADIERENVIKACLLHDVGNIVKFDFEYTKKYLPGLLDSQESAYWQQVQGEYRKKYGKESHGATAKIITELGVSERVFELIDCIGFDKGEANLKTEDFAKKICAYSDMRVEPQGVVTLEKRFLGLRHRYQNHPEGSENREVFENALRGIEKQIFANCKIRPEDVVDSVPLRRIEKLKMVEI